MEGTNTGHENAEGMASVGVRLTAQLGNGAFCLITDDLLSIRTCQVHESHHVENHRSPKN